MRPTCAGTCAQLVERTLGSLCARFNAAGASPRVGVVRLSGLAHAADRVAFREIARQLCRCSLRARTLPALPTACPCSLFPHRPHPVVVLRSSRALVADRTKWAALDLAR